MNLTGLLMLQPDLDAACSASDLAQSTVYYNFILIARACGGSHYFVTLALDLMASTTSQTCKHDSAAASTSYFILTAIARVLASLNVRHPS